MHFLCKMDFKNISTCQEHINLYFNFQTTLSLLINFTVINSNFSPRDGDLESFSKKYRDLRSQLS